MTQITLSTNTQKAILAALGSPGTNNSNYLSAYNDIYSDIQNAGMNSGTVTWFSQAGLVNGQAFNASAAGTFIWNYTIAAAKAEGYTVTNGELQTASNRIAHEVFQTLKDDGWKFSDGSNLGQFSPTRIITDDAGTGIGYLQTLFPNLDFAVWGGTLFARTSLNDPTYVQDYHLDLTAGSRDCKAILAGNEAGFNAVITTPSVLIGALGSVFSKDGSIISACYRYEPIINNYFQYDEYLNNGTGGFAQKFADLNQAINLLAYSPGNTAAVKASAAVLRTDLAGYLAPTAGETWNTAAAAYGISGSLLGDINGVSVTGNEAIVPGPILVPFSTTIVGGTQAVSGSTADNYAYDLETHAYYVTGESLTDANQGALTLFDAAGNMMTVGPGLASSLTESGSGVTVNLSAGGVSYSLSLASGNSGSLGFGSSGDISVRLGDLSAIVLANGGLSLSAGGATDFVSSNATGTSASIVGNNLVATLAGSRDTLDVTGINDVVNATGGTIAVEANSTADVNGNGDTVDLAAGSEVGLSGTNDVVNAAGSTVALAANSTADVNGNNDTVDLATGSEVGLSGINDAVNAAGSTVALAANSTADVNGNNDTVDLAAYAAAGSRPASNDVSPTMGAPLRSVPHPGTIFDGGGHLSSHSPLLAAQESSADRRLEPRSRSPARFAPVVPARAASRLRRRSRPANGATASRRGPHQPRFSEPMRPRSA